MAKYYQPHSKYELPYNLYMQIIFIIKDYDEVMQNGFGHWKGEQRILEHNAVQAAADDLPEEIRDAIYNNIVFEKSLSATCPDMPVKVLSSEKARFIYDVASRLHRTPLKW